MTDQARIKLAEAMGWTHTNDEKPAGMLMDPAAGWWRSPDGGWSVSLDFYPFTDANDDYACLEWMRDSDRSDFTDSTYGRFLRAMSDNIWVPHRPPYNDQWWNYKIGDYARAACRVLGIEVTE